MTERSGPCLEKHCSWCCNPVKIDRRKGVVSEFDIPKDSEGNDLWIKTGEELAPEEKIETVRIDTYECKNFNKETGLCEDYENRPQICKNSGCVDKKSELSVDDQYNKNINTKFIVTKRKV